MYFDPHKRSSIYFVICPEIDYIVRFPSSNLAIIHAKACHKENLEVWVQDQNGLLTWEP